MRLDSFDDNLAFVRAHFDCCLLGVRKVDWQPTCEQMRNFVTQCYSWMVDTYRKMEASQEYYFTTHLMMARDCFSGEEVCYLVEHGFTESESSATHAAGWELQSLLEHRERHDHPIDFEFYVYGLRD